MEEIAAEMRRHRQVLAVVNTKSDAVKLLEALGDSNALHLSTSLCGAHRLDVIAAVKDRLQSGKELSLVSTQVIEAGVDLDFPVVMGAMGPLDRIVQAAGRCNREGRLYLGQVIVFDPAEGRLPHGSYRTATQDAASLIAEGRIDPNDPALSSEYFRRLYSLVDLDGYEIQDRRKHFDYPEVARRYKFIKDETIPVVVATWRPNVVEPMINHIRGRLAQA